MTFYIGFTNHIIRRVIEHQFGLNSGFTKKYNLKHLLYFEKYQYVDKAIAREKELKGWNRKKKIDLVKSINPNMEDLGEKLFKDYSITERQIREYVKYNKR
jgi:putative endonuclease